MSQDTKKASQPHDTASVSKVGTRTFGGMRDRTARLISDMDGFRRDLHWLTKQGTGADSGTQVQAVSVLSKLRERLGELVDSKALPKIEVPQAMQLIAELTCRALGDADRHKGWNECVINLMDSIARSWCNSSKKWSEKWWGSRLDTQPGRQKFVYVILNKYWQKQVAGKEAIAVPADASPEVAARYAQHYFSEKAKAHGFGELDDRSAMVTVIGNLLMGPASAPAAKAASVLFAALMPFVTPIPGETKGLLKAIVRASWDNLESPHVADFFGAVAQSVGFSAGDGTVKALDLMANLPYAKSAREAVMPVAIALAGAADSPNQPWRLDEFDTPEGRRNVIQRRVGELVADRASAISSANDALVNCIWLIDNFVDHAPMIDAARVLAVALLKMDAKLRAALFRSLGYQELTALLHHLTNVARNDPNAQAVSALVLELKSMLFT